jgi:hypothetical protein
VEDPSKGIAKLSWTVAESPGSEQRVAQTTYMLGFERDVFVTTEPVPPDQSTFIWEQPSPGIIHYWWVLTRHADGWVPSEVESFEGATCAVDLMN